MGFAVLGCGRIGMRRARTIAEQSGARLAAVADVDAERARLVAGRFGVRCYVDPARVVDRDDVDTVVICTPNATHASLAIAAMRAGRHVICEKPLADTPAAAAAMVAEAARSRVTLKVGSNFRYFPTIAKARDVLDAAGIGRVLSFRGWIGNSGWAKESWFADPAMSGGGTVLDNGCHLFDVIRWFLGEVDTCFGEARTLGDPVQVEDNGVAVFVTADGRLATATMSWTQWAGYFGIEITGTDGLLVINNRFPATTVELIRRDGARTRWDLKQSDTYALELADYLTARSAGRTPKPDGVDGLRAVEMAHAVYASVQSGQRVRVHPGNDHRIG